MIPCAHRRPRLVAAVSGALILAVAVMHILMVGCLSGESMTTDSHADHGPALSAAATSVTEHVGATTDCVMGDHACVFVRADAVLLTITVGLVLAVAPLAVAVATRLTRRGEVLGRSPPWAILGHLELSVIRR